MRYHIKKTTYNGFRCPCCQKTNTSTWLVNTLEEALAEIPTEFPIDGEGCPLEIVITDTLEGHDIATSQLSFPPFWSREALYQYTRWDLYISKETDRGLELRLIIDGSRYDVDTPLKFITDRPWAQLCDEIKEQKRSRDIAKAEADKLAAEKRLAYLKNTQKG